MKKDNYSFEIDYEAESNKIVMHKFRMSFDDIKDIKSNEPIDSNLNRPSLYLFYDTNEIYVGETTSVLNRLNEHMGTKKFKSGMEALCFISKNFDNSLTYNVETKLIEFLKAAEPQKTLNRKMQIGHEFHGWLNVKPVFEEIIDILYRDKVVSKNKEEVFASNLYRISPYKSLNREQLNVMERIMMNMEGLTVLKGLPGTGKTIVAFTLFLKMCEKHKVCYISGTSHLDNEIKYIFKMYDNEHGSKVMMADEFLKSNEKFDYIIIDEGHRLKRRKGKFSSYSEVKYLDENNYQDQLEAIEDKCKNILFIYDQNQSVKDLDIVFNDKHSLWNKIVNEESLTIQMRARGAEELFRSLFGILNNGSYEKVVKNTYDFQVFDDFKVFYNKLKEQSEVHKLVRLVSGYAYEWVSKDDKNKFDFEFGQIKLKWNSERYTKKDGSWINSQPATKLEEVGYFDYVQGFDLNYAGVIIGNDLYLDENGELKVNEDFVFNNNLKPNKASLIELHGDNYKYFYDKELFERVINRYKILLTRGSIGLYVFCENERLVKVLCDIFIDKH